MCAVTGDWSLVGIATDDSEVDFFVESTFEAEFDVLGKSASDLLPVINKSHGLTLRLTVDGHFKQVVAGPVRTDWFDVEGVLDCEIQPFDGYFNSIEKRLYLIADERAGWATSKDASKRERFRHDDGDTVICDFVEMVEEKLFHSVNVLTDGTYLNRMLLVYKRI